METEDLLVASQKLRNARVWGHFGFESTTCGDKKIEIGFERRIGVKV